MTPEEKAQLQAELAELRAQCNRLLPVAAEVDRLQAIITRNRKAFVQLKQAASRQRDRAIRAEAALAEARRPRPRAKTHDELIADSFADLFKKGGGDA